MEKIVIVGKRVKYTEEDYIKRCKELNLEYVGFYKRIEPHRDTMVQFICPIHRDKGIQECDWGHFRVLRKGCPYCSGRYRTTEEFIPMVKDKNVEIISEYLGNEKPIKCRCKHCGNEWTTLAKVLMTNGSGCPVCGIHKRTEARRKTQKQFLKEISIRRPDIEVIGEYKNYHTPIQVKCRKCGYEWSSEPANLFYENVRCRDCYKEISYGEKKLLDILDSHNIDHCPQCTMDGLKYKRNLRFDTYSKSYNVAFEFNGKQHYIPISFGDMSEEEALRHFKIIQERDQTKRDFCNENNIHLIEIPYWETDNMESFIFDKLNNFGINITE